MKLRRMPFIMCYLGPEVKNVRIFGLKPTWEVGICLAGCNFKCKGCYTLARKKIGKLLSVDEVTDIYIRTCKYAYNELSDVTITGGEPTLDPDYLIKLVTNLGSLKHRMGNLK